MNINLKGNGGFFFSGGSVLQAGGLKSAMERQERKAKSEREIAFYEKQKENLKNKECETIEEIERKLEELHTYEDEIAAVKASYNREEMFHILDEAKEQGEKNAEAVEKSKPKTPEERKKDLAEEALGLDEEKGVLSEVMEEITEAVEEITEAVGEITETVEETIESSVEETSEEALMQRKEAWQMQEAEAVEKQNGRFYERFDARI